MDDVFVREDYALVVACEYCHLGAAEAVAVLRHRLESRQDTEACRSCVERMAGEVGAQMQLARAS